MILLIAFSNHQTCKGFVINPVDKGKCIIKNFPLQKKLPNDAAFEFQSWGSSEDVDLE